MDCVAVIPARYGSSRFPGKALADLAGRPLIAHVVERCGRVRDVEAVVVATDDARIAEVAEDAGARAVMTDPELASGTDRVAAALEEIEAEIVLNVQGDEPLLDPEQLSGALTAFRGLSDDYGTLRAPLARAEDLWDPNAVKVVIDAQGRALYFSRAPVPFPREADVPGATGAERGGEIALPGAAGPAGPYWLHVGVYLYRRSGLTRWARIPRSSLERVEALEQLRVLEAGYEIRTFPITEAVPGVDTPADLERVRRVYEARLGEP